MITGLDHVVVLLNDIEKAAAAYQLLLGRAPSWRNQSDGTETVLFTLDNMTLELMSPKGNSANATRIRKLLKIWGEGLASLCFRIDDIVGTRRRLERVALQPDAIVDVERRDTVSGATLAWKRFRTATEMTRGVRMFFLELAQERPPSEVIASAPVGGLDHVVISTEDPLRAASLYGARLGLELTLDRLRSDGGQSMVFLCGDVDLEVVRRPVAGADENNDKLWGLGWRVADIEATRSRLIAAGLDVSDIRQGRDRGTRVLNVRDGACGIHTQLVQRSDEVDA